MIEDFLIGALAMGYGTAGLFFLRFWDRSRDRIFAFFAAAFFLMAVDRVLLAVLHEHEAGALAPYLVRLLAFSIPLGAIIDKNLRRS